MPPSNASLIAPHECQYPQSPNHLQPFCLLEAFALNKRMDKASGVVEYMKSKDMLPNLVIWTTLINGYPLTPSKSNLYRITETLTLVLGVRLFFNYPSGLVSRPMMMPPDQGAQCDAQGLVPFSLNNVS